MTLCEKKAFHIKSAIWKQGLTVTEVNKRLGGSKRRILTTLSKLKTGTIQELNLQTYRDIAKAIGVPVCDLIIEE